jgi:hypothetical protein
MPPLTDEKPPISHRRQPNRNCGEMPMDLAFVGRTSRSAADLLVSLSAPSRPSNDNENRLRAGSVSDLVWSFSSPPPPRFFNGAPMDPRPSNDNENRLRAGSVSDLVWSFSSPPPPRFFNGVPMDPRPTNGAENPPIGAGSVSDLVWFFSATSPVFQGSGTQIQFQVFNGMHMALRLTNGAENPPIGAGSVSDLVWFFNAGVARPPTPAEPPLRSTK